MYAFARRAECRRTVYGFPGVACMYMSLFYKNNDILPLKLRIKTKPFARTNKMHHHRYIRHTDHGAGVLRAVLRPVPVVWTQERYNCVSYVRGDKLRLKLHSVLGLHVGQYCHELPHPTCRLLVVHDLSDWQ
jgi:hypothetical protein